MTQIGRVRRFLNLTQLDLYLATGIPIHRISAAERELADLSETEQRLVSVFLSERLRTLHVPDESKHTAEIHAQTDDLESKARSVSARLVQLEV